MSIRKKAKNKIQKYTIESVIKRVGIQMLNK